MEKNIDYAIKLLKANSHSFVLILKNEVHTSDEIGIKPIMTFLRQDKASLKDGLVADKVIGKAAALMLSLSKVKAVFGDVMSQTAIEVLKKANIEFSYGEVVPFIKNRKNTGICPLEQSVLEVESPEIAFDVLEETIKKLMQSSPK